MPRPQAVAFDIIGTVFPLDPLRPRLEALGLPALSLEFIYTAALRDSFALACAHGYTPFADVFAGALDELLTIQGVRPTVAGRQAVLDGLTDLDAAPDAKDAFAALKAKNIRVFALSNGAAASTARLLARSGLTALVDDVLSVENVKLSKPRPETYLYAARVAGLAPGAMALVATHPWDVAGAMAADLKGGYVARGRPYPSFFTAPTVTGGTLAEVVRALVDG